MNLKEYKIQNWVNSEILTTLDFPTLRILLLKIDVTITPPINGIRNLIAINSQDEIVWIAELPPYPYHYYQDIFVKDSKLYARSNSIRNEIDFKTGKILVEQFVK